MVSSVGIRSNSKITRFSKSSILGKGTDLVNVKDDGRLKEYLWWNGLIKPKETFNAKKTKGFLIVKLFLYGYLNRITTHRSNKDKDLMYPYLKILLNNEEIYRTKVLHSSLNIWEEKVDIEIHYIKSKIEIQLYEMDETEGIVEDEYMGSAFIDVLYLQLSKKYDIILKYSNKVGHLIDPYHYRKKLHDEASREPKEGQTGEPTHNNCCTNSVNDTSSPGQEKFPNDYNVRIFAKLVNRKNCNNLVLQLNCISSLNYSYVHGNNEILDKELNINQLYDELKNIKGNVETVWLPFFSIIYNFASWRAPLYSAFFLIFFSFSFLYSKFFLSFFLLALSIMLFILVSIIKESDKIKRNGQISTWAKAGWTSNARSLTGQERKEGRKKEKRSKRFNYWMQAKNLGGYCQPQGGKLGLNDNTLKENGDSGSISENSGSYSSCSSTDLSTDHSSGLSDSCGSGTESSARLNSGGECNSVEGGPKRDNGEKGAKDGTGEQKKDTWSNYNTKEKQSNSNHPSGKREHKKVNGYMEKNTADMSEDSAKEGKTKRRINSSNCTREVSTDNDDTSSELNLTENGSSSNESGGDNLHVIKTFVSNIIDDEIINNVKYFHYIIFYFTRWSQILFLFLRRFGYILVVITLLFCFLNIYFYPLVGRFLRFSIFSSGFIFLTYNLKPTNILYRFVLCIQEYYFWGPSRRSMDIFSASQGASTRNTSA
ncbi:conserved Plasmodium protein, unknown function [Plasmodium knowlesi strain H]|uniref:Uncharacterized protein n=3 Tax=Plasmodium knowlesi TaxID=5850 RepID=A0A5K1UIA3_PLAKH|nr:conserved Plasmodium protein, unknown function [Plasmodium knowlesi strain H]OTN65204.1 Uncharacterized protein PKNOH_S120125500 [Plasmodium knowlesi]CAA9988121.1 conserved Plasmodium protein, unknown function [Plasmodium knowlesi strain H]SBO20001.1 conserved Plasmodium protein, unknown function [Plasmodium knowlesi strain H]SBO29124.1 conserved Plasmodium protein, unknown function [Plasmodium knowlesi strain H]VVS77595.1 conserved Plasmodium protein, unknown function [Plasmodium knowlesi |eukprot:XP_002259095.1 hypothetical protein, conserved in Plasmodium species [Plasmodium knowlesi strain H]